MSWRPRPKSDKFGNTKIACALGHSHRSKLESAVCGIAQLRERAGELKLTGAEVTVYLSDARIAYIVDLVAEQEGKPLYIEAKGYQTPEWRIKRRLWMTYGPAPLEVWTGTHVRPVLSETIIPEESKCPTNG